MRNCGSKDAEVGTRAICPGFSRVAVLATASCVVSVLVSPVPALGQGREDLKTTTLISTSITGDMANGPSRNPAISTDGRYARVVAFESDATDIVAGDDNGQTDIFARFRTGMFSNEGEQWEPGETLLISRGIGGQPANGPSYRPAIDGSPNAVPRCIAFVSAASNLVAGDTNGEPDAFVYDLATQVIARVSVGSHGEQANGATLDVAVDSRCNRVAFTSDATNLALDDLDGLLDRQRRSWRAAITSRGNGSKQVYVRIIGARHALDQALKGLTFLASASNRGVAGHGDSFDPAFASSRDNVLAFTSTASLLPGDQNGTSDVYVRKLGRVLSRRKHGAQRTVGAIRPSTELISARPDGLAGNGPSSSPSLNGRGDFVFFQTEADDLLGGDVNRVADVARADRTYSPPSLEWVSKSGDQIGNGASARPCASMGGTNAVFQSDASNFLVESERAGGSDVNGVQDIFIWTVNRHLAILESRSLEGTLLDGASSNCALSARTNYILFESTASLPDPMLEPINVASERYSQIFMRYLGPQTVD